MILDETELLVIMRLLHYFSILLRHKSSWHVGHTLLNTIISVAFLFTFELEWLVVWVISPQFRLHNFLLIVWMIGFRTLYASDCWDDSILEYIHVLVFERGRLLMLFEEFLALKCQILVNVVLKQV